MVLQTSAARAATIAGPAGTLEALIDEPAGGIGSRVAVVCHPHPLYGGNMTNKVTHMLAKAFTDVGAVALRFNYRGVGASAGTYDDGRGETADALSVLDWAQREWPAAQLWLGGFSFGGAIAIRAASERDVRILVTVAPAVDRVGVAAAESPRCPWLLVQGDSDDVVDPKQVERWAMNLPVKPHVVMLAGVEHFFHGKLNELRSVVVKWLTKYASPEADAGGGTA
jgi:uncharacterized protein